jgi:hypothetical protein
MDPEDGNARTIGRGCKKQAGRCNFAEFMAFIELTISEGELKTLLNGLNPTNVDEGARMLDERGINGQYSSGNIANVREPYEAFRVAGR